MCKERGKSGNYMAKKKPTPKANNNSLNTGQGSIETRNKTREQNIGNKETKSKSTRQCPLAHYLEQNIAFVTLKKSERGFLVWFLFLIRHIQSSLKQGWKIRW